MHSSIQGEVRRLNSILHRSNMSYSRDIELIKFSLHSVRQAVAADGSLDPASRLRFSEAELEEAIPIPTTPEKVREVVKALKEYAVERLMSGKHGIDRDELEIAADEVFKATVDFLGAATCGAFGRRINEPRYGITCSAAPSSTKKSIS